MSVLWTPFQLPQLHHCSFRLYAHHRDEERENTIPCSFCLYAHHRDEEREDTIPSQAWEIKEPKDTKICLQQSFLTRVTSSSHSPHSPLSPSGISLSDKELSERPVNERIQSLISIIIKGETPPTLILLPPVTHPHPLQLYRGGN